jgi:hypothetical protein
VVVAKSWNFKASQIRSKPLVPAYCVVERAASSIGKRPLTTACASIWTSDTSLCVHPMYKYIFRLDFYCKFTHFNDLVIPLFTFAGVAGVSEQPPQPSQFDPMVLGLLLAFRLSPPLLNVTRTGYFMESFTLLDGDRLELEGHEKDIFVAVHPHHMMGELHSAINRDGSLEDSIRHFPGDRFRVTDETLVLNYSSRGGAVINVWQLPEGFCHNHNVFSTQQREAYIRIDRKFDGKDKICWFFNFRRDVRASGVVIEGRRGVLVQAGDNASFCDHGFDEMAEGTGLHSHLKDLILVVFEARPGNVEFEVSLESKVPYADWTDRPSLFHDRGSDEELDLPLYLVTVRDVQPWVWVAMAAPAAIILLYLATVLFLHPVSQPVPTVIPVSAVARFLQGGKAKAE